MREISKHKFLTNSKRKYMHSSKSSISSIYFNDAPASHFVNSKEYKQELMIAKYASLNKFLFSREFFFQIARTNFIPDRIK